MRKRWCRGVDEIALFHYRWRGWIGGLFAVALLLSPREVRGYCGVVIGLLLWCTGAALRIWARTYNGPHTRGGRWEAEVLVEEGPYAKMRHPLYLSNALIGGGFLLLSGASAVWAISIGVVWLFHSIQLGRAEDRFLIDLHSVNWWFWAMRTPFWGWNSREVPRVVRSVHEAAPVRRSARRAFFADGWSWFWQLLLLFLLVSPWRGWEG